jgi:hypothetical protein
MHDGRLIMNNERRRLWVFRALVGASFAACVAAGVLSGTNVARAFPEVRFWHMPASGMASTTGNRAGAEGNYFTGGAQDHGLRCAHCHIGGAGSIGATITAVPAFGTSTDGDFRITPGTRYRITVTMTGEHLTAVRPGTSTRTDHNGMTATIEDDAGARAGRYVADSGQDSMSCPTMPAATTTGTTTLYGDCHGVLFTASPGNTHWTFDWVAPATVTGLLHLWMGIVDGDTGGDSSLMDDTFQHEYILSTR